MATTLPQSVGTTPAVLQRIISYLPEHQILMAQRVSKLWKKTIIESSTIKTKLFLESVSDEIAAPVASSTHDPADLRVELWLGELLATGIPVYKGAFKINMIFSPRSNPTRRPTTVRKTPAGQLTTIFLEFPEATWNPNAANDTEPSWHKMFLTLPPVTKVTLVDGVIVEAPGGVTLGHINERTLWWAAQGTEIAVRFIARDVDWVQTPIVPRPVNGTTRGGPVVSQAEFSEYETKAPWAR